MKFCVGKQIDGLKPDCRMRLKDDRLTHFGQILATAVVVDQSNPRSNRRLGNQINELSRNLLSYLIAQSE